MMQLAIPNLAALVEAVLAASTSKTSSLHGEGHWQCVCWTGLDLCRQVPDADRDIVFLFGLLHDSQRWSDGSDRDHGRRAGKFATKLQGQFFDLSDERLGRLVRACNEHADGFVEKNDATVGVCWDADRLNLWRVGIKPDPRLLSTDPAKDPQRIQRAGQFEGNGMSWKKILQKRHE